MSCFLRRLFHTHFLLTLLITSTFSFSCCSQATAQRRGKSNDPMQKLVQTLKDNSTLHRDLEYARVGNRSLKLNLVVPKKSSRPTPLAIWIHGGGWNAGSKDGVSPALALMLVGYSVASIEYRFLDDAPFPAQIHDCKAAVRWLRANADKYNLDPDKFAVWGHSAGGHLASLLGTSGDVEELEGRVGNHTDVSSRVQAVCNYCGPMDMVYVLNSDKEIDLPRELKEVPAKLFSGPVSGREAEAEKYSPLTYATRDDPPILIVLGEKDPLVKVDQARKFEPKLKSGGVKADTIVVPNAGHTGKEFYNPILLKRIAAFFDAAW